MILINIVQEIYNQFQVIYFLKICQTKFEVILSSCLFLQFVEDNFEDEGLELETWSPDDWTPNPEFIAKLKKPQLRGLAKRINRLWKELSRKIKEDVKDNPSLYSIIYVPNGFVVPGGIHIKINNVNQ